jgi:hypothetical protein
VDLTPIESALCLNETTKVGKELDHWNELYMSVRQVICHPMICKYFLSLCQCEQYSKYFLLGRSINELFGMIKSKIITKKGLAEAVSRDSSIVLKATENSCSIIRIILTMNQIMGVSHGRAKENGNLTIREVKYHLYIILKLINILILTHIPVFSTS